MPSMSRCFVDTSGWADPLLHNNPDGDAMAVYYRQLIASKRPLVTTNYVIAELVALLNARSRLPRPRLLEIVNSIRRIPQLTIVYADRAIDDATWALLEQYDDKARSLVDAASFVVMRQLGIAEAFTSDQHFAQAGFIRVPIQ